MLEFKSSTQKEMTDTSGFMVRVLGVGGAGANALDRIALEGMEEADLVIMNTDERALSTSVCNKKIQLGADLTKGLGTGGDPDMGHEAALEAADAIREIVKNQSVVFICAGLGGGTGSGAAPVAARIAKQEGAFVVVFATIPFSFEGRRRLDQAHQALDRLRGDANALLVFDNDRMGELILPKEGIQKAFAAADKIISQSVRAITQLVSRPGLIRIGLDDLLSALRNNDGRCLFGVGSAKGQNRAQGALKKALKSPLLDEGHLLNKARNVLVHISGGESLTLYEAELLMKELGKHVRDEAQIFFGTSIDSTMGEELGVTIISSLQAGAMHRDEDEDEPEEEEEPEPKAAAAAAAAAGGAGAAAGAAKDGEEKEKGEAEAKAEAEAEAKAKAEPAPEPEPAKPAPEPEPEPESKAKEEPAPAPEPEPEPGPKAEKPAKATKEEEVPAAKEEPPEPEPAPKPDSEAEAKTEKASESAPPRGEWAPAPQRELDPNDIELDSDPEPLASGGASPGELPPPSIDEKLETSKEPDIEPGAELPSPSSAKADDADAGGEESRDSPPEEAPPEGRPSGKKRTKQEELDLERAGRGRFEKSEPTIVDGEDLDVPAFLRDGD